VIGAFRSSHCSVVPVSSCYLSGPLLYHLCFRNFNSTIDINRMNSYVDSSLIPHVYHCGLDLVPDRIVAAVIGVFRNGGGMGTGESCIPVFCNPLCIGLAVSSM